jgi:hypothetical protein
VIITLLRFRAPLHGKGANEEKWFDADWFRMLSFSRCWQLDLLCCLFGSIATGWQRVENAEFPVKVI